MNATITEFVANNGNLVLLGVIPLVCFVIGERVFARLLARTSFLVDSTEGPVQPASSFSQSIGAPFSAASGATTVVGVGICATFGWAPAYLWAVIGSLFGGGVFACASFWLVRQYPTRGASEIIAALLGRHTLSLFYIVLGVLLGALAPILALATGELLAANGGASLAILSTILFLLIGAVFARLQLITPILCIGVGVAMLSVSDQYEVGMQGYVSINLGEHTSVLPARAIWTLLVAGLCGWTAERSRRDGSIATMLGGAASLGLLVLMIVVLFGLMSINPTIVAPAFSTQHDPLMVAPVLVVLMTGGAITAFHAFVNDPEIGNWRGNGLRIAYARAALDGLLAITVVLTTATIGTSSAEWQAMVGTVDTQSPIHLWLAQFAIGVSLIAPEIGVNAEFARNFVIFVMILASLSALERCFRVLHYLLSEIVASTPANRVPLARRWFYLVIFVFACAMYVKRYGIGYSLWPLMGAASQIFTATILGVVVINLRRKLKPAKIPLLVCAILWLLVVAGCTVLGLKALREVQLMYLALWLVLTIISISLASRLFWRLRKVSRALDTPNTATVTQDMPPQTQ